MFHALIQSYADALYVATTLRPPLSPPSGCVRECIAGSDAHTETGPSSRPASRIGRWLRTRLGRGFDATVASALRPLPKI
jgi:hypothetical protein